jgi:casein kinase 1
MEEKISEKKEESDKKINEAPQNFREMFIFDDNNNKLGKGSFGYIVPGINKITGEEIAVKIERKVDDPQLKYEYKIYKLLKDGSGFPKIFGYFEEGNHNILIMEKLGPSLEKLFNKNKKKFSLLTVIMIVEQILYRLEFIHSKNIVHRDIKPDNFLIGLGNKNKIIYAIDYGLSKKFKESKSGLHIPYRDGKCLLGTARYASINTHLGVEQSRRDDIEALGYMMVYFMKGHLPWQGMINTSNPNKKYDKIKKLKIKIKLNELCQGLPEETIKFIQYARDMRFEDKPNYSYLRSLMRKIAVNNGIKIDYNQFDWIIDEQNNDDE